MIYHLICTIALLLIFLIAFIWHYYKHATILNLLPSVDICIILTIVFIHFFTSFSQHLIVRKRLFYTNSIMNIIINLIFLTLVLSFIETNPLPSNQKVLVDSFIKTKVFNRTINLFLKSNAVIEKKQFFGFLIVPCKLKKIISLMLFN